MQLDLLTLFAEDTPASHFLQPGSAEARKMTATSGWKCIGSWLPSGPVGCLLKTLLGISAWASTKCYLTWKAKATPAGRLLFQLAPSMPNIEGIGSGLLPMMVAYDATPGGPNNHYKGWATRRSIDRAEAYTVETSYRHAQEERQAEFAKKGQDLQLPLNVAVKMFPTPTVQDASNNGGPSQADRNTPPLNAIAGGALNPQWVEWLMGFPEGWTDLDR